VPEKRRQKLGQEESKFIWLHRRVEREIDRERDIYRER
jgi:hypothetical protein